MSEENNENPQSGGVNVEQEPAQNEQQYESESFRVKSFYYYDSKQGCEHSKNIFAILLPSMKTIFVKSRVYGDQVLIPLNGKFLKIWRDDKNNLLYNITDISEPLFTKMFKTENIYGTTAEIEDGIKATIIVDNKKYEIELNDKFFKSINCGMKDMLALALYHLYISPLF
ncbi:MAG: hypothetical protein ACP5G1_04115 [Nanopusillaceae archaeon]